jgi:hypothetical protein
MAKRNEDSLKIWWSMVNNIFFFKHGTKSYEIVDYILAKMFPNRSDLVIVDLTYGLGRFYRYSKKRIKQIIAVDIAKYSWEVAPTTFYQMPCQIFVDKVLRNEIALPSSIDLIVVDPPWSHEKRGVVPKGVGYAIMPYHLKYVDSKAIFVAAMKLCKHLHVPLLYRYKEFIKCDHIVAVEAEVKIMRKRGAIYYGVCKYY